MLAGVYGTVCLSAGCTGSQADTAAFCPDPVAEAFDDDAQTPLGFSAREMVDDHLAEMSFVPAWYEDPLALAGTRWSRAITLVEGSARLLTSGGICPPRLEVDVEVALAGDVASGVGQGTISGETPGRSVLLAAFLDLRWDPGVEQRVDAWVDENMPGGEVSGRGASIVEPFGTRNLAVQVADAQGAPIWTFIQNGAY